MGAEIRKSRPCVVVNNNIVGRLPLKIIVPLTEWNDKYKGAAWHIPIEKSTTNGLAKKSSADTFQVRSLAEERLINKLGVLSPEEMERIEAGLKIVLDLET
jgi:mRNA interferase MazF